MDNRFRRTYRQLSEKEISAMNNIKDKAEELAVLFDNEPNSRYRSLAMTKLEESVMWMVKGITN